MKFIKKISTWIKDFLKKRFIHNQIKGLMKSKGKIIGNKFVNNEVDKVKLEMLTKAIFRASKVVEGEMAEVMLKNKKYEDEQLLTDLKKTIAKHFSEKVKKLTKENRTLHK